MNQLRVCLVQADLQWENKTENLNHLYSLIKNVADADVFFLPEMFATGFSMDAKKCASDANGVAVNWMKKVATEKNAVITGSLNIEEGGMFYNRLFWVQPDGKIITYNKRHLFSLAGEEKIFSAGTDRFLIDYKGWKIMPQVCFDLRFPVFSRNDLGYDLLFYVANWPARRSFAWQQLLRARAIENQSFVIGVNRVGEDGNGVSHSGDSAVLGPLGEDLWVCEPNIELVQTLTLTKEVLRKVRGKFGFLADQDQFGIKL